MKNLVSCLILSLLLLGFLSGCSNPSSKQPNQSGAGRKTLTIKQTETDPNSIKVLDEIIVEFKKTHPNIDVELESVKWDDLYQKLVLGMETGNEPDLTHLQPFMVYSLYAKNKLEPIDEVIKSIGEGNIYTSVRDLQKFDGHYYGLAYAVGTTFYSYRKDLAQKLHLSIPKTWQEYVKFISALNDSKNGVYGTNLPGGSAFFMQVLFSEFVASNGGRLFDEGGNPTFTEKEVLETLEYFKQLAQNSPPEWGTAEYNDQFKNLINGKTASVPLTFARFTRQIEKDMSADKSNPEIFSVMEQPVGPSGKHGIATMDCEPWVVFSSSDVKEEAKEFLQLFYKPENYLRYTLQVPIHLTPILKSVAESDAYLNNPDVKEWQSWQELSFKKLNQGNVRPILIVNYSDLRLPFLMELQGSNILSDMITDVTSGKRDPLEAAKYAQEKAIALIKK